VRIGEEVKRTLHNKEETFFSSKDIKNAQKDVKLMKEILGRPDSLQQPIRGEIEERIPLKRQLKMFWQPMPESFQNP
jgi:Holliday junction resolvase RusA-like endonuclease